MELARKHHLRVLGLLLAPPAYISTCPDGPDPGRCAAADTEEFGRLAGEIAEHAQDTIRPLGDPERAGRRLGVRRARRRNTRRC